MTTDRSKCYTNRAMTFIWQSCILKLWKNNSITLHLLFLNFSDQCGLFVANLVVYLANSDGNRKLKEVICPRGKKFVKTKTLFCYYLRWQVKGLSHECNLLTLFGSVFLCIFYLCLLLLYCYVLGHKNMLMLPNANS